MKRGGRKFDHRTLEAVRLMAVERVRNGEKPSASSVAFGAGEAEADARATLAINDWVEQNIALLSDRFIPLPVFLNLLPFGADRKVIVDLGRYRTMPPSRLAVSSRSLPTAKERRRRG